MARRWWTTAFWGVPEKRRWEREGVTEAVQRRLD